MKIIFIDWKSYGKDDIKKVMKAMGHTVVDFYHKDYKLRKSDSFLDAFDSFVQKNGADLVFSSNYFPMVSNVCNAHNIPYVSWVYDCPFLALYSTTVLNPCNRIYVFDSSTYNDFHSSGIETFRYLPLAAPIDRLDAMVPDFSIHQELDCDISFVGSMYDEAHNFFDDNFQNLPAYSRGYLDAIMQAQLGIYGENIIEPLLKGQVLEDIRNAVHYTPMSDGAETDTYVYSRFFIERKITSMERKALLGRISEQFHVKLYTHNPVPYLPKVDYVGPIDYIDVMPYVFKCSKINLNITLRSIHTGIPLRAFDIMGSGGFLLTNFQADFLEYFEPDKDFVYFESPEDLTDKCRFYLAHDEIRQKIDKSGYEKVKAHHTYEARLKEMLVI